MTRTLIAAMAMSLLATLPASAYAAPCKDAKGKFTKCPTAAPTPSRCRLNGKFVKCGTPGAKPA